MHKAIWGNLCLACIIGGLVLVLISNLVDITMEVLLHHSKNESTPPPVTENALRLSDNLEESGRVELKQMALYSLQHASFDNATIKLLTAMALEGNECGLGESATQTLGSGPEDRILDLLETIAIEAPCLCVRKEAVNQLANIGSSEARTALKRILLETGG